MKDFFFASIFLFFLIIMPLFSCTGQTKVVPAYELKPDSVELKFPHKIITKYLINKNYRDISEYIIFGRGDADAVKYFASDQDTLTISWYYDKKIYDYNVITEVLNHLIKDDDFDLCEKSITKIDFKEIIGEYIQASCKDKGNSKIIFIGLNNANHFYVKIVFETKVNNGNFKNAFWDLLKSLTFK